MDINTIRGLITLVLLLAFVAMALWLASPRSKHRFDAVARLPLEDDAPSNPKSAPIPSPTKGEGVNAKEHTR